MEKRNSSDCQANSGVRHKDIKEVYPSLSLSCSQHTVKTGSRYPYFIHSFYLKPFHFPACFNHPDSWLLGLSSLYYLQSPLGLLLEMFRALAILLYPLIKLFLLSWHISHSPNPRFSGQRLQKFLPSRSSQAGEQKTRKPAIPGQCSKRSGWSMCRVLWEQRENEST